MMPAAIFVILGILLPRPAYNIMSTRSKDQYPLDFIQSSIPKNDFEPYSYRHSEEGDFLECYFIKEDYYGMWINPHVTVFISEKTDEIIGLELNGIKQFTNGEAEPKLRQTFKKLKQHLEKSSNNSKDPRSK